MRSALLALMVCLLVLPAPAKYRSGSGTADDPYQIATAADLIALGETPADYDKHFILTGDIDLDPNLPGNRVFDKAVIAADRDPGDSWWGLPVFTGSCFTGLFDGNGHKIMHLTIRGASYVGLFGQLGLRDQGGPLSEVRNLRVEDVNIAGSGKYVGAMVGENNWGILTHAYSSGIISGDENVGGLAGYNWQTMTDCHSAATVVGASQVGGLVGGSYAALHSCRATGRVMGTSQVGGLVGFHRGTVSQCYSTGEASGDHYVGGLIGYCGSEGARPQPGSIDRSYSLTNVRGEAYVGGLVGRHQNGTVRQCYSAGVVSGSTSVGGLVGGGWSSNIKECFWDVETSGLTVSHMGEGKTTAQMQTARTFLDAGWDFLGEATHGLHELWQMPEGGGYPILTAFNGYTPPQLEGEGTREDPYLISNAAELGAMIHYGADAHYRLTSSIDLSGIHWTRPVLPHFAGTFDGGGHTISYLTMTGSETVGLFRGLDEGAQVSDLGIVDANIVGSGISVVGGLMTYNWGFVTRCYITGTVSGIGVIGGLVGSNEGKVTCCYSTAVVSGTSAVGGLVGRNWGTVAQCYGAGRVSGDSSVGGLVGVNYVGYNQGNVADCFWDTDTSGPLSKESGTGKTTAEMQTASTFLEAGWDFVGETENGTEDIWWIEEGKDYPRLWWETAPE